MEDHFDTTKYSVLKHVQKLFQEMEEEMAISHQEKYALLEDAFESASDAEELRVAFDQWFHDHADDVEFEHEAHELWEHAVAGSEDEDDEDTDEYIEDEEEEIV